MARRHGGRSGERATETDYLHLLGERVRETRARRGMTRKILARDSAVSERYLAQLESGEGNISIILLRQVAHAMGVPLADLVHEGPEQPIELTLLTQFLARHVIHHSFQNELCCRIIIEERNEAGMSGNAALGVLRLDQARLRIGCPVSDVIDQIVRVAGIGDRHQLRFVLNLLGLAVGHAADDLRQKLHHVYVGGAHACIERPHKRLLHQIFGANRTCKRILRRDPLQPGPIGRREGADRGGDLIPAACGGGLAQTHTGYLLGLLCGRIAKRGHRQPMSASDTSSA